MKKLLTFSNSATLIVTLVLIVGLLAPIAEAEVTGAPGIIVDTYYANPHGEGEIINSFDFGRKGQLYYTTGIKGPEGCEIGFTVYKYDGESYESIHYDEDAFGFSGGRIRRYGNRMLFNDGATMVRKGFNYYSYDQKEREPIITIIDSTQPGAANIWSLSTRDGTDLWAAGAASLSMGGLNRSHIFYGSLDFDDDGDEDDDYGDNDDSNGNLTMIDLGFVGGGSGPLAFDSAGNLYYAQGFNNLPSFIDSNIYLFSAAEVAAAIDDPVNNPLEIADHVWATIPINSGALGASSMFFDDELGLVLTTTLGHGPSQLRRYAINPDGTSDDYTVLAISTGRMSETRHHKGKIYFNDPDGIYCIEKPGRAHEIY